MQNRHIILALIFAALTFVLDQGVKYYLREIVQLEAIQPWVISPNIDLVLVWNRGVSYGLLQQNSTWGQIALVVVKLAMVAWLCWWLLRGAGRLQSLSLGLVIGGALGNILDNILFGGVMDYVHFHVGTFSWYIFNLADAAIVAGAAGLLYAAIWGTSDETHA